MLSVQHDGPVCELTAWREEGGGGEALRASIGPTVSAAQELLCISEIPILCYALSRSLSEGSLQQLPQGVRGMGLQTLAGT